MKQLSIIVAIYNTAKFLDKCIQSLVSQTLDDFEIILVNDCSPDNSREIMQKWQESHPAIIKLIDSPENRRQGGARNLGLELAEGKYIAFVDSDDWVEQNAYFNLLEKSTSEPDIIYTNSYFENGADYEKVIQTSVSIFSGEIDTVTRDKFIQKTIGVWQCLYKKSYLDNNRFRFVEKLAFEDCMWTYENAIFAKTIAFDQTPFYHYRQVETSTVNKKNDSYHLDRLLVAKLFLEKYKNSELNIITPEIVEFFVIYMHYLGAKLAGGIKFQPPRYDLMGKALEIKRIFPNFRKNKYYKQKSFMKRFIFLLSDCFPLIFVICYKFTK